MTSIHRKAQFPPRPTLPKAARYILYGQTEKGNVLIGGATKLDFSSINSLWKTDDNGGEAGKTTSFELSPQIGVFLNEGLVLGVELPISYSSEKDEIETYLSQWANTVPYYIKVKTYLPLDLIKDEIDRLKQIPER